MPCNESSTKKVTVVNSYIKKERSRTSLVAQGVRNPPTSAESMGSVPDSLTREIGSLKPCDAAKNFF